MPEQPASYYDAIYKKPYDPRIQGIYNEIRDILIERGMQQKDVLEIGCGVGVLAQTLFEAGFTRYTGFDFSRTGVLQAQRRNNKHQGCFFVDNAYSTPILKHPWTSIISTEVFEHLDDLRVISRMEVGTFLIFCVPTYPDIAHVRTYPTEKFIREYYKEYLNIESVKVVDKQNWAHKKHLVVAHRVRNV